MPIYEYYCSEHHTIYQFYAKSVAQGQTVPRCPGHPAHKLRKLVSGFAITGRGGKEEPATPKPGAGGDPAEDAKMEAAMSSMESEFAGVDENDPKAMARMMRRMSEISGEKLDGQMEEVVRKLEEGADPESLEDQLGGPEGPEDSGDPMGGGMGLDPGMPAAGGPPDPKEPRHRFKVRRTAPRRDPQLYDYE
jgi:putative FmdB family regulatory protein